MHYRPYCYLSSHDSTVAKDPITHTITHIQCTKNEEFWPMRCDSLGVRQNPLMI